jgi:hypothetical protein
LSESEIRHQKGAKGKGYPFSGGALRKVGPLGDGVPIIFSQGISHLVVSETPILSRACTNHDIHHSFIRIQCVSLHCTKYAFIHWLLTAITNLPNANSPFLNFLLFRSKRTKIVFIL